MERKYYYLVLQLIFVSFYVSAQYQVDRNRQIDIKGNRLSDIEFENLNGKVKTVSERYGTAKLIDGQVHLDTLKRWEAIERTYDMHGNIIKTEYLRDGIIFNHENIYNETGQIIIIKVKNEIKNHSLKYKYDKNGRISSYKGSKVSYDEDGFVSKFNGKLYKYEFDGEDKTLFNSNLIVTSTTRSGIVKKYTFNKKGLLTYEELMSTMIGSEKYESFSQYSYDSNDNIRMVKYAWKDVYMYDDYNNWIEKVRYQFTNILHYYYKGSTYGFVEDDYNKLLLYKKRTITYYE